MKSGLRAKIISAAAAVVLLLTGCSITGEEAMKLRDLEFTVVSEDRLPEELHALIEEKKAEEFKFTYADNEFLYLCIGYGEQSSGGYSIAVNELYLTDNAIYADTSLLGPSAEEKANQALSYPYIVIKTELLDKSVVFE